MPIEHPDFKLTSRQRRLIEALGEPESDEAIARRKELAKQNKDKAVEEYSASLLGD